MPRANKVVSNVHFHKNWERRVKTWFDQPAKKKIRRLNRIRKAARSFPRPVDKLRPVVRCPSIRFNSRVRLGRGFTLDEIKAAGLTVDYARSVGIAFDRRRRNRSEEGLAANVLRLKEYKAKLVVWPTKTQLRKAKKAKTTVEIPDASTFKVVKTTPLPLAEAAVPAVEYKAITDEAKAFKAYRTVRDTRLAKPRALRKARKEAQIAKTGLAAAATAAAKK